MTVNAFDMDDRGIRKTSTMKRLQIGMTGFSILAALCVGQQHVRATGFSVTDLVSDIPGQAANLDPNLVNPWGIAFTPSSPFWVADNRTGVSTLYNGTGIALPLVVTVPPPAGGNPPAAPTGVVFNGGAGFEASPGLPARFIFASEDGTISGWNPTANPTAALRVADNSGSGANYKGLAIGNNGAGDFIYAANFHAGTIDVFDSLFAQSALPGNFTDPNLPSGYAPFNIQNIGGKLYVTYALQDAQGNEVVSGAGHGFVDVFDLNGNFLQRLASQGSLNSPWGLAIAPSGFGPFANDLLVGNFGDGRINAFDPVTGMLLGTLDDMGGSPLEIQGLRALTFGNGANAGDTSDLYFTAGIPGNGVVGDHGLFGEITFGSAASNVPEGGANSALLLGAALVGMVAFKRYRNAVLRQEAVILS